MTILVKILVKIHSRFPNKNKNRHFQHSKVFRKTNDFNHFPIANEFLSVNSRLTCIKLKRFCKFQKDIQFKIFINCNQSLFHIWKFKWKIKKLVYWKNRADIRGLVNLIYSILFWLFFVFLANSWVAIYF